MTGKEQPSSWRGRWDEVATMPSEQPAKPDERAPVLASGETLHRRYHEVWYPDGSVRVLDIEEWIE